MIANHALWPYPEKAGRLKNRDRLGSWPPYFGSWPDLRTKRLPHADVFDPGHIKRCQLFVTN